MAKEFRRDEVIFVADLHEGECMPDRLRIRGVYRYQGTDFTLQTPMSFGLPLGRVRITIERIPPDEEVKHGH